MNDQRADPLPRSITLEISQSLLASLRDIATTGIDGDGYALGELLDVLIRDLETSVLSYRGLQLTISSNGFPLVVTAFADGHDGHVATSLRVPLALLDPGYAAASRVVFYAGTPGAFVDLAADLAFAFRGANTSERAEDSAPAIRLDEDTPPRTRGFSLSGLRELSAIDRAVGVLIVQGHHPDHAHATLRRYAARADIEPHIWAAELLLQTSTRQPE